MNVVRCFCGFGLISLLLIGCSSSNERGLKSSFDAEASQEIAISKSLSSETYTSLKSRKASGKLPALRKMIYSGNLRLVVNNFDGVDEEILDLVDKHNGFVASSNVQSQQHDRRTGRWSVRIPSSEFRHFFEAVQNIGIPEVANKTSKDVTEEYVDLEARIKSKKQLEERVLKLLEHNEQGLQQVISLEKELERIRSEIERMEGRLRYLKNRVELTSIDIQCREQEDYVPPQTPGFDRQVSSAWADSTNNLQGTGESIAIWFAGAGPWLIVLSIPTTILIIIAFFYRKIYRRRRAKNLIATN